MTLTVDGLRGFIETSLDDTSLGLLLDAAYEAIDRALGPLGYDDTPAAVTEILTVGPGDLLMLSRPATAITAVTEWETDLSADDYELLGDQMVYRLSTGTHQRGTWDRRVRITYTPTADVNERDRAAVALVRLDLDYQPGVQSERLGDHSITFATGSREYVEQRDAILASIAGGFVAK